MNSPLEFKSHDERQRLTAIGMENDNEASSTATPTLESRYEDLSHDLKPCFVYLSVFPKMVWQ